MVAKLKRSRAVTPTVEQSAPTNEDPQDSQTHPLQSDQPQARGEKGTKRRKIESSFSDRVRTYQEQDGDDTALTATADRWESVARELRSGTAEDGKGQGKELTARRRGRGKMTDTSTEPTDLVYDQIMYFCQVFGRPAPPDYMA